MVRANGPECRSLAPSFPRLDPHDRREMAMACRRPAKIAGLAAPLPERRGIPCPILPRRSETGIGTAFALIPHAGTGSGSGGPIQPSERHGPEDFKGRHEKMSLEDSLFGVHGKALQLRSQRLELIASNIANASTPGYKARDIDFRRCACRSDQVAGRHGCRRAQRVDGLSRPAPAFQRAATRSRCRPSRRSLRKTPSSIARPSLPRGPPQHHHARALRGE